MDEHELSRYMFCITKHYNNIRFEVVARNEVNYIPLDRLPLVLIVNTSDRTFKRSSYAHWVVFVVTETHTDYMDPLGLCYTKYGIKPHFKVTSKYTRQIQDNESDTCGLFCLYYVYKRLLGVKPATIYTKVFSDNLKDNERVIELFKLFLFRKCKTPLPDRKSFLCSSPACDVLKHVLLQS